MWVPIIHYAVEGRELFNAAQRDIQTNNNDQLMPDIWLLGLGTFERSDDKKTSFI